MFSARSTSTKYATLGAVLASGSMLEDFPEQLFRLVLHLTLLRAQASPSPLRRTPCLTQFDAFLS
jgi:hypothetical protein